MSDFEAIHTLYYQLLTLNLPYVPLNKPNTQQHPTLAHTTKKPTPSLCSLIRIRTYENIKIFFS